MHGEWGGPHGIFVQQTFAELSLMRSPATTAVSAQAVRLGETRDGHLTDWWEAREEEGLANEGMKKDAPGRRLAARANER